MLHLEQQGTIRPYNIVQGSPQVPKTRTTGSGSDILTYLSSLLHRLPPLEPGGRPIINEVQPDMHPLEILADVKKLMNIHYVG